MVDDENGPSLEPPSLFGLGRRRRSRRPQTQPETSGPAPVDGFGATGGEQPSTAAPDESPAATSATTSPLTPPPGPPGAERPPREYAVDGRVAAAVAGLLVGLGVVGATAASFNLCERIQGTNSCGGPGIFLLLAILIAAVAVGAGVLRVCRVPEPLSTAFLAVSLLSVVALLFLVEALFSPWMFVVIPLVSVASFLGSHWITTTFVEPEPQVGLSQEPEVVDHDVR